MAARSSAVADRSVGQAVIVVCPEYGLTGPYFPPAPSARASAVAFAQVRVPNRLLCVHVAPASKRACRCGFPCFCV